MPSGGAGRRGEPLRAQAGTGQPRPRQAGRGARTRPLPAEQFGGCHLRPCDGSRTRSTRPAAPRGRHGRPSNGPAVQPSAAGEAWRMRRWRNARADAALAPAPGRVRPDAARARSHGVRLAGSCPAARPPESAGERAPVPAAVAERRAARGRRPDLESGRAEARAQARGRAGAMPARAGRQADRGSPADRPCGALRGRRTAPAAPTGRSGRPCRRPRLPPRRRRA